MTIADVTKYSMIVTFKQLDDKPLAVRACSVDACWPVANGTTIIVRGAWITVADTYETVMSELGWAKPRPEQSK